MLFLGPGWRTKSSRKFTQGVSVTSSSGSITMMTPLRHLHNLRALVPRFARERLYEWHPGRARRWQQWPGVQVVEPRGQLVMTLDDGPDEDATPAVLDALDAASSRATFFMLASQVARHDAIAHEVMRRGHEIALHGYCHPRHDRVASAESWDDVMRGFEAIEAATGVRCRWFRPPFGRMSVASAKACRDLGMTPVYWSAWGLDWENVGPRRIVDVASRLIDDGGILLLHDSARYGRRPSAIPTAEAIPMIAERAAARSISLVSLEQAVCHEPTA